jgi:hypothetical protein
VGITAGITGKTPTVAWNPARALASRRSGREAATGIPQMMTPDTLLLVSATILLWGLAALLLI